MAMWLTAGQADEWLAAEPDAAMAMLLANYSPVGTRIDRPEDRQADGTQGPAGRPQSSYLIF